MRSAEKAIVKTLVYSDIFEFPLSYDELWRFLISKKPVSKKSFNKTLNNKSQEFKVKKGWYYLPKRESLIKTRLQRIKESKKKIEYAKRIASYVSFIPTVCLIGISGALSMENSDSQDDIDLFVITKANTIFLTRFVLILILQAFGVRRNRAAQYAANKVCLNMLIDESAMAFPVARKDLYTAHEIAQMKPLFERNNTYQKFLGANLWVKEFLPNHSQKNAEVSVVPRSVLRSSALVLSALEFFAKKLQLWYMKRHITNETITNRMLAFHPLDYKKIVFKEYKERLRKYKLSYEKI